jgi:hypothetical protein
MPPLMTRRLGPPGEGRKSRGESHFPPRAIDLHIIECIGRKSTLPFCHVRATMQFLFKESGVEESFLPSYAPLCFLNFIYFTTLSVPFKLS